MKLFNTLDNYEKYEILTEFRHPKTLSPNDSFIMKFDCNICENSEYRLQLRIDNEFNKKWRTESTYPILYRRIGESLNGEVLEAIGDGQPISRNIYYKVYKDELDGSKDFEFSVEYSINGSVEYAHAVIEVYYDNNNSRTIESRTAEIIKQIDMESTEGQTVIKSVDIKAEEDIDFIFVRVETEALNGELRIKAPRLMDGDCNKLKPFEKEPLALVTPRWVGENFSKIEWIPFQIQINKTTVFDGYKFDRIFCNPAIEFDIPDGLLKSSDNELIVVYPQDYVGQGKIKLNAVKLISNIKRGIVAYDKTASAGEFPVLIKAVKGDAISIIGATGINTVTENFTADEDRLYVVKFNVTESFDGSKNLTVNVGNEVQCVNIKRFIQKTDRVLVGTGDTIYIDLKKRDMSKFLAWYFANGAGNMVTFRTSYRWSGCTYIEDGFWDYITGILDDMGVRYSIMTDGRELNSAKSNSDNTCSGKLFDGYQSHEQDGAYLYWGSNKIGAREAFFNELCSRRLGKQGMLPSGSVVRKGDNFYKHFDGTAPENMQEANEQLINNFKRMTHDSTRHTGPSMMHKYIAEAGITFLGAELMYGSYDAIIAALRGAAKAIDEKDYGGHIAIQWSTTPHDTIYRYRRYLLSLYNCYLNGVHNINTEEGIYRIEEKYAEYERDSDACLNHLSIEREFYDFVRNHNRRGEQKTDIGILYGHYDGMDAFQRRSVYQMKGSEWKFAAPEKSWDLITKVFYKGAKLKSLYFHPCLNSNNGYFASTRYGQIDIVPIEANYEHLSKYRVLAFLGWNTADEEMAEKLYEYVENGGILLLAAPHLYTTVYRERALTHSSHLLLNDTVKKLLGVNDLKRDSRVSIETAEECGNKFRVSPQEVLVNKVGAGTVYFVNHFKYPADIKTLYTRILDQLARENAAKDAKNGVVITNDFVTTSIFDADDRRVINLLDIRWWRKNKKSEHATITFKNHSYRLTVIRDVLNQVSIFDDVAIMTYDNCTDIIGRNENTVTLQGDGVRTIKLLREGNIEEITVDFTKTGKTVIKL